jgi:hypothetical protein
MAIEAQELTAIKSSISVAMSGSAGQFRQAATAGAANMTKIVKDISNIFAAQRKDLAELTNVMNETLHEMEQTNSKFDNLERVFEESVSIQNAMQGELKNISKVMKNMTDSIYQLDRNIQSSLTSGPNSLLGGLSSVFTSGLGGVTGKLGEILLKVGVPVAAGAAGAAGYNYMTGGGGPVNPIPSSGSLAQNQQMAYSAAKSEVSDSGARVLTANMSGESLANPGLRRWDLKHYSQGIVQWEDRRAEKIKKQFGKLPIEMTVEEQTKAALWEMKTDYPQVYEALKNPNLNDRQKMEILVRDYERPKYPERDIERRLGILAGMKVGGGNETSKKQNTETTTTPTQSSENSGGATPVTTPAAAIPAGGSTPSDAHNHKEETVGKDAEKTKGQGAGSGLPGGDLVALGKTLQQRGIRVSEHPAFGGVSHVHGPNSAHYQGNAIDINATSGNNVEANDPVMGPKFDKLAQELQAAGYTVLWKVRNHFNHIHAQIGGQGIRGGKSAIGGAATSDYTDTNKATVTPGATPTVTSAPTVSETTPTTMVPPPTTPSSTMATPSPTITPSSAVETAPIQQATPVSQEAISPAVSSAASSVTTPGESGNIFESISSMLESLIGSLLPTEAQAGQVQNAELLQSLQRSEVASASETIKQAAMQSQIPQESAASQSMTTPISSHSSLEGYNYQQPGYAYNYDVGWADWAARLGGNHWKEMQKYKESLIA